MRYAIVSDIHANMQAWHAVLRDIRKEGVDSILCLGDVIGYGPNPVEVLDSCYQNIDYFILGNHDAVIGNRLDSNLFNENAKYLIEWTRDQLNDAAAGFFADMPLRMEGDGFICAHAELAMPGRFNYIYEAQDAIESFTSNLSPLMFVGHTHFPAKFTYDLGTNLVHKDLCTNSFLLPNKRYLINVGSVGDPRDGNTTASYCIYDAETNYLQYRQVGFDIRKFKKNLLKAQLPIQPYFLSVYEGAVKEGQTIKDMEVMESNQAAEAEDAVQRINRDIDAKTSRQKITFSLDDVRSSRKNKEEKKRKHQSEAESKKRGLKFFATLFVLAALTGAGFFVWKNLEAKNLEGSPQIDQNKITENTREVKQETVLIQESGKDLLMTVDTMVKNKNFDIEGAYLRNWKKHSDKLRWKVDMSEKGWYKVFIDHSKEKGEEQIEITLGTLAFAGVLKTSRGQQEVGIFENSQTGPMDFSISLASTTDTEVTRLKSVRLQYAGEEKPFDYTQETESLGDFESGTYRDWITSGAAFGLKPVSEENLPDGIEIQGVRAKWAAASVAYKASTKGLIRTPLFDVRHKLLCMMAAGGKDCFVNLYVDGELSETITFSKMGPLKKYFIDLKPYAGKKAYLECVDNGSEYMAFDKVTLISGDRRTFTPGDAKTIKGKANTASVNQLNKFLSKAGSKLVKKDFKGCLRDIEEAAVITGTDMSNYIYSINAVSDLERLFIGSFQKDLKKTVEIKSKATGGGTQVTVDSVKGDKVFVKVGDAETLTPLKMAHISEEGIKDRLMQVKDGLLAFYIHKETIKDNLQFLKYNAQTPIAVLVNAAFGRLKVNYPKGSIVGNSVEIWAMQPAANTKWAVSIIAGNGEVVFENAEIVNISELLKGFRVKDLLKKDFKVYKYNLTTEKVIKELSFKNTEGQLKVMLIIIRNSQGKIVWQKAYNENILPKSNLLDKGPYKFYLRYSQPESDNLALGKEFTSSNPHSGGYAGINDGIWSFTPPFLFGSSKKDNFPKYVTVDLGQTQKINALRFGVPNRGSTKNISLQYSLNNNEFISLMDFDFSQGITDRYMAFFKEVEARYIRVRFNYNFAGKLKEDENTHVFLSELEAYYFD